MIRPTTIIAGILAALVLLFSAYMGAYYAMLTDDRSGGAWLDKHTLRYSPTYRIQGSAVKQVFWPAHQIDSLIRPDSWKTKGLGGLEEPANPAFAQSSHPGELHGRWVVIARATA